MSKASINVLRNPLELLGEGDKVEKLYELLDIYPLFPICSWGIRIVATSMKSGSYNFLVYRRYEGEEEDALRFQFLLDHNNELRIIFSSANSNYNPLSVDLMVKIQEYLKETGVLVKVNYDEIE